MDSDPWPHYNSDVLTMDVITGTLFGKTEFWRAKHRKLNVSFDMFAFKLHPARIVVTLLNLGNSIRYSLHFNCLN
jgi:hypothetical protein